jgi:FAD/FMN-containing dehydrogenase
MGQAAAAWVAASEFEALPFLLRSLKRSLGSALCAFEFMSDRYVGTVCRLTGATAPVQVAGAWHVLIEAAGNAWQPMEEALQEALSRSMETGEIGDCAVAASVAHREAFWRVREAIPEVLTHLKPAATLDIGLPWARTADYLKKVDAELQSRLPQAEHLFLGHLGDNNLHLISGPVDEAGVHTVDEIAYGALRGCGGTVSAEHGVGRLKKGYLAVCRSPEELALMRRLKQALDPTGILNRGRIID